MSHTISSSLSDLFHSAWHSLGPSMLLQMAFFHFFMSNIPLYICTTFYLSIPLLMEFQQTILKAIIMLLNTLGTFPHIFFFTFFFFFLLFHILCAYYIRRSVTLVGLKECVEPIRKGIR